MRHLFQRAVISFLSSFWGAQIVKKNITLKLLENLKSAPKLIILLEILVYTLNVLSKFGGRRTHSKDL